MPIAQQYRPFPFNADPATSSGEFSRLDALLTDAVNEFGEKNADTLIAKYSNPIINAANRVIDDINKHPYFLKMLELQFDDGVASVVADSNKITVVSGFTAIGAYTPLRLKAVGYGTAPGDVITFTMANWAANTGNTQLLQIADVPHVTKVDCVVAPVFKARLGRYTSITDQREVSDRVIIEGIKFYWSADRDTTTRPAMVKKTYTMYFEALNGWLAQLRNLLGPLEIDHDARGYDY